MAQESSGKFTGGSVLIGYDNRTCSGTLEGAIRYNSATSTAEFCDGASWVAPGCTPDPACPNVGDVCDDGNAGNDPDPKFAGFLSYNDSNSVDAGKCKALYVTQANQSTSSKWKTSTGNDDIASDSIEDGKLNDGQVPNSSTFPAFKLCKDLTDGGYTDWYLPARTELDLLWINQSAIGGFSSSIYWTSWEGTNSVSWEQNMFDGKWNTQTKTNSYYVRCVRR